MENSRELVFQCNKIKLYHYQTKKKKKHTIPLLIVFATVNRPDILDMFPDASFINGLLAQGMDVYLLDWGYPDSSDKEMAFSDYVTQYVKSCVSFINEKSGCKKINLVGICQGGVISLCYAAIYENINSLVLISTPIDFHTKDNAVTSFLNKASVETLPDFPANVPGLWLTQFFISLKPLESVGLKYAKLAQQMTDEKKVERFFKIEKWLYDAPDQPAKAFSEFIRNFYQENQLINGRVEIEGKRVNLESLSIPILNIIAKHDEIIPPSASKLLKKIIPDNRYTQKYLDSGHIGIYVSEKTADKLPKAVARWLLNQQQGGI